jgi:hypothetical protein
VTITYPNGTVLQALVLSHDENEIRAIAAGCDDVLEFTRVHDAWISESMEPVTIEFAWQRRPTSNRPSEAACICPKPLAALLIESLFCGREPEQAGRDTLYVFSPEGHRITIRMSELQAS